MGRGHDPWPPPGATPGFYYTNNVIPGSAVPKMNYIPANVRSWLDIQSPGTLRRC